MFCRIGNVFDFTEKITDQSREPSESSLAVSLDSLPGFCGQPHFLSLLSDSQRSRSGCQKKKPQQLLPAAPDRRKLRCADIFTSRSVNMSDSHIMNDKCVVMHA